VRSDFKLYSVNAGLVEKSSPDYSIIGRKYRENLSMLKMLDGFQCEFSKRVIGETEGVFDGSSSALRERESALANFIADLMKEKSGTDIAIINGGSIRNGLKKGILNEKDVYSVFPFKDTLVSGSIRGSELRTVLDIFAKEGRGNGGFLHFSGISIIIEGERVRKIMVNGKELIDDREYSYSVNSFLAEGGDGYGIFKTLKGKKQTGYAIPDLIIQHIRKEKVITPPETSGRIKFR